MVSNAVDLRKGASSSQDPISQCDSVDSRGYENPDYAQTHDGENANNQPPSLGLILGQNPTIPNFGIDEARLSTVSPVSRNMPSASAMWPSKMGRQRQLRVWRVRVGDDEDREEVWHRS